jgi:hypothetical protein
MTKPVKSSQFERERTRVGERERERERRRFYIEFVFIFVINNLYINIILVDYHSSACSSVDRASVS